MLSPTAWTNLPETEKLTAFENAKQLAGLRSKNSIDHIYRPLLAMIPDSYMSAYKAVLDSAYPDGEYCQFHNKAATLENYTTLYNWLGKNCEKCGSSNLAWEQGDKSICTYCENCRHEKPFVKGCGWY
jgi:formamidopyrimidine-DNA glycosylase